MLDVNIQYLCSAQVPYKKNVLPPTDGKLRLKGSNRELVVCPESHS